MLNLKQNKKGKVLIVFLALSIIGLLIFLVIATNNLDGPAVENFGQIQKHTIRTVNQKDSLLLYMDNAAELAKRDVSQKELAENAGFYNEIDSSDPNSKITECGTHVYNLLSDTQGKSCVENYDYEAEYFYLFRDKLEMYTSRHNDLKEIEFNHFDILNNSLVPTNLDEVYLLITNKYFDYTALPEGGILDLAIEPSDYNKKVTEEILDVDLSLEPFKSMEKGRCSKHVYWLLKTAYADKFVGVDCLPGHAWGVAACYLNKAKSNPENSRVVYAGPGISFEELFLEDNLLKEGDILFTSSKTTWCKWTGFNEYSGANVCDYSKGTDNASLYTRDDASAGFCVEDTIELGENPLYCSFSEYGLEYEPYPIITHIFIYLGEHSGKHKIGNLYGKHAYDKDLEIFLGSYGKSDGIRIIVRPDYSEI